jgi:1,2-phenylacetyl-CoA epoxidase PaaB subunit
MVLAVLIHIYIRIRVIRLWAMEDSKIVTMFSDPVFACQSNNFLPSHRKIYSVLSACSGRYCSDNFPRNLLTLTVWFNCQCSPVW